MSKRMYESGVNITLKNEVEHQLSLQNIITRPKNKVPILVFLQFSSAIRPLISALLFQIAERVKFNETALLKVHHMVNNQIKDVLFLFHS